MSSSPKGGESVVISFEDYLRDYPVKHEPKTRVINLCDTERYLSKGYYCSLLAEARRHKVFPSVKTINDMRGDGVSGLEVLPLKGDLERLDRAELTDPDGFFVFFGSCQYPGLERVAKRIFSSYPTPVFKILFSETMGTLRLSVEAVSMSQLNPDQHQTCLNKLGEFTRTIWRNRSRKRAYRWDMAILVNESERLPPSNREALSRFIRAAAKQGIDARTLSAEQIQDLAYFDALFIRETTAIDHHTYRLSSRAEQLGLVVLDDPASILRCCNKVYLHDAFDYLKVPSLRTEVVSDAEDATLDHIEVSFGYPVVLKMPESSFSKGVFKLTDRAGLQRKLQDLLADSSLVLVQEFLFTEFDWRIGVLNGRAIYACRYLMARNHWQIYNHDCSRNSSGGFETLPTFEVPRVVLDAALKAAKSVGDGLYGVDIKHHQGHAYVLEVNDNPSIDSGVEDAYLGEELYMVIMSEFQRRLEERGRK